MMRSPLIPRNRHLDSVYWWTLEPAMLSSDVLATDLGHTALSISPTTVEELT